MWNFHRRQDRNDHEVPYVGVDLRSGFWACPVALSNGWRNGISSENKQAIKETARALPQKELKDQPKINVAAEKKGKPAG